MDIDSPILENKNIKIDDEIEVDVSIYDNINLIPSEVTINNGNGFEYFKITKYTDKLEKYDIKREINEIIFPLRLYSYEPDNTFTAIDIEMAIIFLSNMINKINIKHNRPVIKSLRREDMILVDLVTGDIKMHNDGINILQNLYPQVTFHDIDVMTTSDLIVFVPICIILENTYGHFNILVINNKTKSVSLYEPYGIQGVGNIDNLSEIHKNRFRKTLNYIKNEILKEFSEYKWISSHSENDGIQYRSDMYTRKKYNISENYCVAWCLYICLFRIYNIHLDTKIPSSIILNQIYNNFFSDSDLNLFIRRFASMIKESTDNYQSDIYSTNRSAFLGYKKVENIDNINISI